MKTTSEDRVRLSGLLRMTPQMRGFLCNGLARETLAMRVTPGRDLTRLYLGDSRKPRQGTGLPLRLALESWLAKETHADLREALRPLVRRVVMSHGEPVLRGANRALERVLAG